jgi:hypothetical protein
MCKTVEKHSLLYVSDVWILFICSLFNDAFSLTTIIDRRMNGWYVKD